MNMPIYRAKKIRSDEYIIGHYTEKVKEYPGKHYIHFNNGYTETYERIDPTTLAIHFPDMLGSEGNKIFASLDRYYIKGADIITNDNFSGEYSIQVAIYSDGCFYVQDKDGEIYNLCENWEKLKVIGIKND